jgi:hypothetical protein
VRVTFLFTQHARKQQDGQQIKEEMASNEKGMANSDQ